MIATSYVDLAVSTRGLSRMETVHHFDMGLFLQRQSSSILLHVVLAVMALLCVCGHAETRFRVLAFYSETVEHDHVDFAHQAIDFYTKAGKQAGYSFEPTTNWDDLNAAKLAGYQLVVWLDDFPHTAAQRAAFEQYMENGGGWLGFHIAAYNDAGTKWSWFVNFLGGGVFYGNEWPPLPATIAVDDRSHALTRRLPASFVSPANEWYIWKPSPRENKDVKVLLTLAPTNYPIGMKDVLLGGDLPVMWTNTRYRMLYTNMGHGDRIFTSDVQNGLLKDMLLWVATRTKAQPAAASCASLSPENCQRVEGEKKLR